MDVFLIGTSCTAFGKYPDKTFKQLTREAFIPLLEDAGLEDGKDIDSIYFSNVKMEMFDQPSIRGQVCLDEMVKEGRLGARAPVVNVEGACATGSVALNAAWKDVLSGQSQMSLAIGVEKTYIPNDPVRQYELFAGALDRFDPQLWQKLYQDAAQSLGMEFDPHAGGGTINMALYAIRANHHMAKHGITQRQYAIAASKTHHHGSLNPLAQYRFDVAVDDVLSDRMVAFPFTRSMCAPIGDGAAAALVCSGKFLQRLPGHVRDRAIKVSASVLTNGSYGSIDTPGASRVAAQHAYSLADIAPGNVDLVELHDPTTFGEIYQAEMLGLCEPGQGGLLAESGATSLGGKIPINVSGGLISKGHPVGATGLSMIHELATQLRQEAGNRQVAGARVGLAQNGGGAIGFDDAICAVTILQAQ